jgi:hypothetical protein
MDRPVIEQDMNSSVHGESIENYSQKKMTLHCDYNLERKQGN